jgi:hypothetical protein
MLHGALAVISTMLASVAPGVASAATGATAAPAAPRDAKEPSAPSDVAPTHSESASTTDHPTTIGLALQVAPLEIFPRWGVNLDVLYALNARWQLGLDGQLLLPHAYGDVTRSGFNVNAQARFTLLGGAHLRWYLTGGVGLGVLRDDYVSRSAFSDRTNVGFGVKVGTGLEARLFGDAPLVAFLEPQVRSYRTASAVDDEWAELNVGLRWRLP